MTNPESRILRLEQLMKAVLEQLGGTIITVDGEYFVAFKEQKERQEVA